MDIMKIIQFGIDYLSNYFMELSLILTNPKICFQPVLETRNSSNLLLVDASSNYKGTKLNPKIFSFMAISIFIGSLFISLFPTYANLPSTNFLSLNTSHSFVEPLGTLELIILTIANWLFSFLAVYAVCIVLRAKVNFWDFATVFLQLQASLYLISNFIAFLWTMLGNSIIRIFGLTVTNDMVNATLQNPALIYYVVHLILTLVYFPIALGSLYKINIIKVLILDLVPALWLTLFLLPSISGQWTWVAYCESCRIQAQLEFLHTQPDPMGAIEQYRREMLSKIVQKTSFGLIISVAFIFAMITSKKRLKN
jgi:hypothetical protein